MRDIKFRAWDKARNEYLSAGSVFIAISPSSRPLNSFIYLDLIEHPDAYRDRFVLEQYTGVRDKNGVEIYEKDIFIMNNPDVKHIVEWHDSGFAGRQSRTRGGYVGLAHWKNNIEIIGNIHINSELLTC